LVFHLFFTCEDAFSSRDCLVDTSERTYMSFGLYAIGFGILIIGLIYGAFLLHLPAHWIVVGAIVLVGAGILSGVKATRQRDTAA
jgi:hypothetical protein